MAVAGQFIEVVLNMIQGGRLRETITLIEPVLDTRNNESGQIEHEVRAEIRAARGNEIYEAIQVNSYLTHRCWIRYMPGVKASWRVRWNERELKIDAAIADAKRRQIELRLIELEPVT